MPSIPERIRLAAESVPPPPPGPEWASYLGKVNQHPYKVLDSDIAALLAAGHSIRQIYEATVATAIQAGLHRLSRGLDALEQVRR
ncbi:MAG: hypothetical protein FJW39_34095 [Acidobacteria bacterium]|nr:hypothetical protein [Acidobacteriota bacterium]